MKPLLFDKINNKETITLTNDGVSLFYDEQTEETFNKRFCNITKKLSLPKNASIKKTSVELFKYPVKLALEKQKDHPSIKSIKKVCMTSVDNARFGFRLASLNKTLDGVNNLNP